MRRPITLVGFILGTVMHSVYTIAELFVVALIIDLVVSAGATTSTFMALILLITLALSIISLVFNAIAISAWNKKPEAYKKKRGIIITAIVFNFIVVLLLIIGMTGKTVGVFDIIFMISLIATNVLAIVDLAREKGKVNKIQAQQDIKVNNISEEQVNIQEE